MSGGNFKHDPERASEAGKRGGKTAVFRKRTPMLTVPAHGCPCTAAVISTVSRGRKVSGKTFFFYGYGEKY
jgi:hypothetical protein